MGVILCSLLVIAFVIAVNEQQDLLSKFKYVDPPALVSTRNGSEAIKLEVVYFAFIHPLRDQYLELMKEQLQSFHCNGIYSRAGKVHIQLSIDTALHGYELSRQVLGDVVDMIHSTMDMEKTRIEVTLENQFEYPGTNEQHLLCFDCCHLSYCKI